MNLLLDSALKATVILLAAWAASLALRRASADIRHTIWLMAVLAVALLPAVLSIPPTAIPTTTRIGVPAMAVGSQVANKLPWLAILWASGAIIMLIRLLAGIAAAARITRSAKPADGILYSDRAATPMTWGFLRPVVILPAYALEWQAAERDLVLRHENAHIARRDWLWQTLASLTTAVFWFHPLMWLANIQLRREAESAVDDCILATGTVPSDYADRLLDVARHLHGFSSPAAVIPMIRKPELETRVRSILDPSRRRSSAGIAFRCVIALAAFALLLPVAVTRAQAQVYKIGQDVSAPSVISKVEPQYTPEARDAKIEGTVTLQVVISAAGAAEDFNVTRSLDPGLDANAITAVSQWRFKPATKEGKPVAVFATIEVTFHLL
jgi:TonB family protein